MHSNSLSFWSNSTPTQSKGTCTHTHHTHTVGIGYYAGYSNSSAIPIEWLYFWFTNSPSSDYFGTHHYAWFHNFLLNEIEKSWQWKRKHHPILYSSRLKSKTSSPRPHPIWLCIRRFHKKREFSILFKYFLELSLKLKWNISWYYFSLSPSSTADAGEWQINLWNDEIDAGKANGEANCFQLK